MTDRTVPTGARLVRLPSMAAGAHGTIAAIPDDPELAALRVLPGEEIEVVESAPLGGPVLVRTRGGLYALGMALARRVLVRR